MATAMGNGGRTYRKRGNARHARSAATLVSIGLCLVVGLSSERVQAYPSAIIFSPSGACLPAGSINLYAYGGIPARAGHLEIHPWTGLQLGVSPGFGGEGGGPRWGGLELGVDAFGTEEGRAKVVVNAKLQILKAWASVGPDASVGVMQVAPAELSQSLNLAYAVLSRELRVNEQSLGTFSIGWAHSFAPSTGLEQGSVFQGTFPFRRAARESILAGYVTPSLGPLSVAVDHFGGVSEASDLYGGLNIAPTQWLLITPGVYVALDREGEADDGMFVNVGVTVDGSSRPAGEQTSPGGPQ